MKRNKLLRLIFPLCISFLWAFEAHSFYEAFDRLEDSPSKIQAAEIRHEQLIERDEESGFVINAPLGTAFEFMNTLEQLQALQQTAFNAMVEDGVPEKEALERLDPQPLEESIETALRQAGASEGEIQTILRNPQVKQVMEEVTAFKEAHQGKGHITLKLEGQAYDPALEQGLMLLARGAMAVEAFSQDHPHLTHYGLMAFDLALSGPGGFVLGQVAQGSGLSQTVYDKIEQGEHWLAGHLEHKMGMDRDSADLLSSAGSFGMQFAIPALIGSKSKQVVDAAHKVSSKVKAGLTKMEKGKMGEARSHAAMKYKDYKALDCRLPRNQGIDGVFVKTNKKTKEVTDIVVVESKYATKGGNPRLAKSGKGDDEVQQLSNPWMGKQLDRMEKVHPEKWRILSQNEDKIRFKANVLDGKGVNRWYDYGKYKPGDTGNKAVKTVISRGK